MLDGWSFWVLVKDLAALYALHTGARSASLPPAPSFADYAVDQAERAGSPEVRANERWWIEQLAGGVPALELPTDRPRPRVRTQTAGRHDHILPAELVAAVQEARRSSTARACSRRCSPAFDALLFRLTGQADSSSASRLPARPASGHDGLVGHCVSMLPLRARVDARRSRSPSSSPRVAAAMLDAYDHQDVTFGRVLQVLPIARDPVALPLISVIFNIDQALTGESHSAAGTRARAAVEPRVATRPSSCSSTRSTAARPACASSASTTPTCSTRPRCARWLAAFETLLRGVVAEPASPLGRLPSARPRSDRARSPRGTSTEAPYPRDARIEELIAATARRVPERIAVRTRRGRHDLRRACARAPGRSPRRCAQLASAPGDRVGLCSSATLDLLPALLGSARVPAPTYVPLDPALPGRPAAPS